MRTLGLALTALSLLTSTGSAQEDWRAFLQKDLVQVQGGLMVLDLFVLERVEFPGVEPIQLQVKYHSPVRHPFRGLPGLFQRLSRCLRL